MDATAVIPFAHRVARSDAASPKWLGDGKQVVFQYDDHGSIQDCRGRSLGKMRVLADGVGGKRRDPSLFGRFVFDLPERPIRLHQGQRNGSGGAGTGTRCAISRRLRH